MKQLRSLIFFVGLLTLPGCGGLVDWSNKTFVQGKSRSVNEKVVNKYLQTLRVYDQFHTVALFNILWLSDEIKTLYSDLYSEMHGKTEEAGKTFLRRQLKANSHYVSFYVLSLNSISLNVKPSPWNLYLEINGKTYTPSEVKAVELPLEYEALFGKYITKHKRPYEIRFERKDADGKDIMPEGTKELVLHFSSAKHFTKALWPLSSPEDQQEKPQE